MDRFTLTLTLAQVNSIVDCMKAAPYEVVSGHIAEFQRQMQPQAELAKARKLVADAEQTPAQPDAEPAAGSP